MNRKEIPEEIRGQIFYKCVIPRLIYDNLNSERETKRKNRSLKMILLIKIYDKTVVVKTERTSIKSNK